VMEFVKGRELKSYFEARERFELKEVVHIMGELCEALHFAHEAGIIHRDIKPANVMMDAAGHPKLTDFGVARLTEDDVPQAEATKVGTIVGTPSYMSPEQIQGQPIDRRSDIFSAGVLFYQFLTGQKPFTGTQWELAKKIIMEDPVWPSQIVQVSPMIDRVVARALAKEPDQRYQTARAFADALKRILEGKPPEDPNEVLPKSATPPPVPQTETSEAEKEFWAEVKDSAEAEDFGLYLEQFPNGEFAEIARQKMAALKG
jgi:serine/threonine protein kinase